MASLAGDKSVSARKEKFGKFVLLEQLDATTLGSDYRAAKLGSAGLEKIVQLLRLSPALSASAESAKVLMDQAKFAAQLQNPNVLKIFGIGKVEGSYYISYEFVEGKSLKTIFNRCRSEGFPFSVDHALLIASKICSALEYAHGRKLEGGARYFHGLVTPNNVVVSYEGEVRLRGFGYWPSGVRELGLVGDDESVYLSPEQSASGAGEPRSDTFAVGAILFEALTGQPLLQPDRRQDITARIANARLQGPSGDEDALPKAIADILNKALAAEPGGRYPEIQEMRKAIDTLLFSGDFTPTTFNLAFFMHSLFREDIERESKVLKEEKEASYFDFLDEAKKTPLPESGPMPTPLPISAPPTPGKAMPIAPPFMAAPPAHTPTPVHREHHEEPHAKPLPLVPPPPRESHVGSHSGSHSVSAPAPAPAGVGAREAAAGFTFHKDEKKGKGGLIIGILAAVVVLGGGTFAFLKMRTTTPPPVAPVATPAPTVDPEVAKKDAQLKALQDQLTDMQAKQAEDAKKAADAAAAKAREAAQKKGAVSADELAKAEAEARKRAEEESRRSAMEQQRQLEGQAKAAAAEKAAAEKASAEKQAAERLAAERAAAEKASEETAPKKTDAPPAVAAGGGEAASNGPRAKRGDLVSINDPGVTRPEFAKKSQPVYPRNALVARVGGTVVVNVLIDEEGKVVDTQLLQKIEHPLGVEMHQAAIASLRASNFKPAMKDGVPVKTWMSVPIRFAVK
jgi:TonB family protein